MGYEAAMATLTVNDLALAHDVQGEGPPLLFVMGFTGSRHTWLGFPERFARDHRVITFDNRGAGETTVTPGPYSIAGLAHDALGLLDALSLPRAVVIGVSMGGMIAQEMALLAPSRVERLVLGCTHFGGATQHLPEPDVLQRFTEVGKRGAGETIRRLLEINFSHAYQQAHPELIDELITYGLAHKMSPIGFFGQMAAIGMHDTEARLGGMSIPTLVLSGTKDQLIPVENARAVAARIPHARLALLKGAGHMFWVEQPEAAERAIREFLSAEASTLTAAPAAR